MPQNRSFFARIQARSARTVLSIAERQMWELFRNKNLRFKFLREYPIGNFRIDFFSREAMLAIELDSELHELEKDPERYRAP